MQQGLLATEHASHSAYSILKSLYSHQEAALSPTGLGTTVCWQYLSTLTCSTIYAHLTFALRVQTSARVICSSIYGFACRRVLCWCIPKRVIGVVVLDSTTVRDLSQSSCQTTNLKLTSAKLLFFVSPKFVAIRELFSVYAGVNWLRNNPFQLLLLMCQWAGPQFAAFSCR